MYIYTAEFKKLNGKTYNKQLEQQEQLLLMLWSVHKNYIQWNVILRIIKHTKVKMINTNCMFTEHAIACLQSIQLHVYRAYNCLFIEHTRNCGSWDQNSLIRNSILSKGENQILYSIIYQKFGVPIQYVDDALLTLLSDKSDKLVIVKWQARWDF